MPRWLDFIIALLSTILLSPVFFIIGVLIKITSPGPAFFKQQRVGKGFKLFQVYKFRTMVKDAPEKGPTITTGNDARITPAGLMLRKYKIDELPQLINILKGEMSFVGPRPEVPEYVGKFKEQYSNILKVRPGITDPASLYCRNEEKILADHSDDPSFYEMVLLPEKLKLSQSYIENKSFLTDIKLITKTIISAFCPEKTQTNI